MIKIIQTEDGSHSIHSEQYDASYHSTHGAIQETQTVFIEAGFNFLAAAGLKQINILEIGFGTGLNAFMTYLEAQKQAVSVLFHSIELHPIGEETAKQLNYPTLLQCPENEEIFRQMHSNENLTVSLPSCDDNFFEFQLKITTFEGAVLPNIYQLIYFDAFAPSVQPHLWEAPFLQKMYDALVPGGIFVTYCAQGAFKRALKEVGFKVEGLPGPKGKREMTRARK